VKNYKRYTVTTALPYANGPVHIGHLAGVYIPADIYVRYLRMQGRKVVFIGGSDEHGVPVTIKARNEDITPQQLVDRYHNIIKQSFKDFGISFDIYSRTSNEHHHKNASEFFKTLYDKGCFIEKTSMQFYDEENKQFLADRYIIGECPHCHAQDAYGDQCEKCGSALSPDELINPRSAISGNTPVKRETKHWYLPLNNYEDFLKQWILEGHRNDWKTNVYGQCKSWIDQGLQPRAVTRDLDWGVKVPLPDAEGKVLYVWFDAPIGYISATQELFADPVLMTDLMAVNPAIANSNPNSWEEYWKSEDTKLVHFIGKDNIVFHCIVFPAMLKAEGSYIMPDNVPANEFLNLEGRKISTSKNWAVWLHEYLTDFPNMQDVLRYVLTANAPETKDNDFTWKDFQARNNNELAAIFGNFVNRIMVLTHKYFEGKVPSCGELQDIDRETVNEMLQYPSKISESIEQYRFREALGEVMNLARLGNKYLTETEPWKLIKTDVERTATVLNISIQIVAHLAVLCEVFLPFTATKIREMLKMGNNLKWDEANREILVEAGVELGEPVILFGKIEDEVIQNQMNKLSLEE
jgi:methionyl-tRNA synthetase